ncbi:hypothetical protein WA026_012661 [Henosepilachna vigintioctopunctata]|uniref:RNA-directed DNA polymerase from mobile element jockey n=1 Tax=Henosepilachna vigintioctopunctata TaxID=420089 RepID=A0AAW1U6R8_9CUCU
MNLKILQWNIRSINCNKYHILQLIKDLDLDMLVLSETFLKPHFNFTLKGFYSLRDDRADGFGGIAFFIKENLQVVNGLHTYPLTPERTQILTITLNNILFINMYNPPDNRLSIPLLDSIIQNSESFVLMGDLNSQHTLWGHYNNYNGNIIKQFIDINDYMILNNGSITRITPPSQNKSSPDITICTTNIGRKATWETIWDPGNSDHLPILITINNFKSKLGTHKVPFPFIRFNTKRAEWNLLNEKLSNEIDRVNNLEDFMELLTQCSVSCIPIKKIYNSKNKTVPWWTNELTNLKKAQRLAINIYFRESSTTNYITVKKTTAQLRQATRKAKQQAFRSLCEQLSDKSLKDAWSFVKNFSRTLNNITAPRTNIKCAKEILLSLTQTRMPINFNLWNMQNNELSHPITIDELVYHIQSKKKNSAPGIDGIDYLIFKNLHIETLYKLKDLFNQTLIEPSLITNLNSSLILLFLKPGKDSNCTSNYRPISLAPCILKILESIINSRLEVLLENNEELYHLQYGFRKGRSVYDCLVYIISKIYKAFVNNNYTIMVTLDLKSAYDMVPLDLLMEDMSILNVPQDLIRLIFNLLYHRKISILDPVTGEVHGPRICSMGLPQGSILSPSLFNIFSRNWNMFMTNEVEIIQYADDLCLLISGDNLQDMGYHINESLLGLNRELQRRNMVLSPHKSKVICFHKSITCPTMPLIVVNNETISRVQTIKYLGILLDSKLLWRPHVEYVCSKAEKGINLLRCLCRTWWGAHPQTLLLLYKSLIRAHLDYGSIFVGRCSKKLFHKMNVVQYQALRVSLGLMKTTPTDIILAESGELPLSIRRKWLAKKFLLKVFHNNHNSIETLRILNDHQGFWGNRIRPPILEVLEGILNITNLLDITDIPRCFSVDQSIHYKQIQYVDSYLKKDMDNNIQFREFLSSNFSGSTAIYTDASDPHDGSNLGIGVFCPHMNVKLSGSLPSYFSICSAEMAAIMIALNFIKTNKLRKCVILSDSKSALETICNWRMGTSNTEFGLCIRKVLYEFASHNVNVQLVWIPSHSNINGNDIADNLAAKGRSCNLINSFKAHYKEMYPVFKQEAMIEWRIAWETLRNRTYYKMNHTIQISKTWFKSINLPRKYITIFSRMRSNHCLTPYHLNKIRILPNNTCSCGEIGTLRHILLECKDNSVNCSLLYVDLIKSGLKAPINFLDIIFLDKPNIHIIKSVVHFLSSSHIKL